MKKGYIFSWYNSGRNYGQTLQAFALQKVVSDIGYSVEHVCFGTNRGISQNFIGKLKDFKKFNTSTPDAFTLPFKNLKRGINHSLWSSEDAYKLSIFTISLFKASNAGVYSFKSLYLNKHHPSLFLLTT